MKYLLSLLLTITSLVSLHAQTTISSQTFNSSTSLPTGWTKSGTFSGQIGIKNTNPSIGYPFASASNNLYDGHTNSSAGIVYVTTSPVNTMGYSAVQLKFGAYKNSYQGSVSIEWTNGSNGWQMLVSGINLPASAVWYGYGPVVLPAEALNLTSLFFRITFNRLVGGSAGVSVFRIDDFIVEGSIGASGGSGGGSGTVSSVGLTMPSEFSVSGSPVTTNGTLSASFVSQTTNTFLAGPSGGGTGIPTFRALSGNDIPASMISYNKIQLVNAQRLLGNSSTGMGPVGEIFIGSGLSLSGGVLSATGGGGGGSGTVTSVGLSLPTLFSVSGSPVTTSGTLTASLALQNANMIFAGPSSGGAGAPTFRTLSPNDIPASTISYNKIQLVNAQKILGNASSIMGPVSELTIGSGLSLSTGGVLSATGGGGSSQWTTSGNNIYYTAGSVGIGTASINDPNYKLFVESGIRTRKVKVDATGIVWPDYVFENEYRLLSLQELEQYIKAHKHLPGVPSAAEIGKNGLDLGDGQAVLLKKIEELTLYMIEMNKKLEKVVAENEALKLKLNHK